ncbi:MAG TPA: outer membrane lipoprotein carrier protein LolA [Candidatus Glassbacteria bacterium]|nr:outer membrane lipoprotein carrier protein LolA [Candidatus Glassbacteria bacterium]
MKNPLKIIISLALFLFASGRVCIAGEVSFESVLAGIDRWYDGVSSLTATFTQLVEVPALEKSERFRGRLYYLKPNLLRLEYDVPRGQLMVADGRWYWFYMPQEDVPQAMRAPMEDGSGAPLYVLGGSLAKRFTGALVGTEPRGGAPCLVLDLVPKAAGSYYLSLRAWVDEQSFATRALRYIDESGNFNTFDLILTGENVKIDPGRFSFTPPPGTQILDSD